MRCALSRPAAPNSTQVTLPFMTYLQGSAKRFGHCDSLSQGNPVVVSWRRLSQWTLHERTCAATTNTTRNTRAGPGRGVKVVRTTQYNTGCTLIPKITTQRVWIVTGSDHGKTKILEGPTRK
ncbi:hypothetical protein NDU88_000441 [Pleurodeles waltl]|uniref:Uncharacterized protein n=1 Tax=Pleurodeles waltl TaxID=8319 RepID=A0AAV7TEW9_PLEWA|nr:hypothetical protein NDU88_000441 [Pleurodeles waltl]